MVSEIWRPTRYAGYFVSNEGRVRRGQRILKGRQHSNGYIRISPGFGKDAYVHDLVLEAFVGPRPAGWEADHINCERSDNRAANLRWLSVADNRARRRRTTGERNGCSKLTATQVQEIRNSAETNSAIAGRYGVTARHIRKIKGGVAWQSTL